jgi:hypothetical protein
MKRWRIRFTLNGQRLETTIEAPSQLRAITMFKVIYPTATGVAADEIH